MPRFLVVALGLCLSLVSVAVSEARADGKVFIPGPAKVTIPDQDALIVWRDGVQTLAIETRFIAPGHDFAWVVPLPAKPEIAPGSTGMFPTLRALFAPRVNNTPSALWLAFVSITLVLLIGMAAKTRWDKLAAALLLMFAILTFLMLPSLGTTRGGGPGPGVDVLDRAVIGSYEVTTVSSTDPAALAKWLTDYGFVMTPAAQPVIADYIAKGWVFSAAKLRRDEDTQKPSSPHPLVFMFKTDAPVYPLRLTGVENGDLKVDLYVFGPSRAAADGFVVQRCAQVDVIEPDPHEWRRGTAEVIEVSHTGLRNLIGPDLVGTKLSATLTPEQMERDAIIRFETGPTYRPEVLTERAAIGRAIDIGAGVIMVGVMIVGLVQGRNPPRRREFKRVLVVIAIAVCTGGIALAATPTIQTKAFREVRLKWFAYSETGMGMVGAAADHREKGGTVDEAWAKQYVEDSLADYLKLGYGPFEQGDGPGCYSYAVTPEGQVSFTWYSDFGHECRVSD